MPRHYLRLLSIVLVFGWPLLGGDRISAAEAQQIAAVPHSPENVMRMDCNGVINGNAIDNGCGCGKPGPEWCGKCSCEEDTTCRFYETWLGDYSDWKIVKGPGAELGCVKEVLTECSAELNRICAGTAANGQRCKAANGQYQAAWADECVVGTFFWRQFKDRCGCNQFVDPAWTEYGGPAVIWNLYDQEIGLETLVSDPDMLAKANECAAKCFGCPANMTQTDCFMYTLWGLNSTGFIDNQCVPYAKSDVDKNRICGNLKMGFGLDQSPISLLWSPEVDINQAWTLTSFPLAPNQSGKHFLWKASADAPLLVYDPEHRGQVRSPEQLFGNWTFGGAASAGLKGAAGAQPRPWTNGFEALASLDANRNGSVDAGELEPLALWFDRNRNGVSEEGEVQHLAELQITALFYDADQFDPATGDLRAVRGYERLIDGQPVVLPAVDWFGKSFTSALEGVIELQARAALSGLLAPANTESAPDAAVESPAQRGPGGSALDGAWVWEADGEDAPYRPKGLLTLRDDGSAMKGHSIVEAPLRGNSSVRAALVISTLKGTRGTNAEGETTAHFELTSTYGQKTTSDVRLSADGQTLYGKSSSALGRAQGQLRPVTINYSWTAKRQM